jgi:hypothetical protein
MSHVLCAVLVCEQIKMAKRQGQACLVVETRMAGMEMNVSHDIPIKVSNYIYITYYINLKVVGSSRCDHRHTPLVFIIDYSSVVTCRILVSRSTQACNYII